MATASAARPRHGRGRYDRLFTGNSAPAVLRFLDEDANPVQEARVVATLPVSPFLRAALRRAS
jgi:hypothetical protein